MDDYFLYEKMSNNTDDYQRSVSSTQEQENEETQTCIKILKTVIIGLSLLIPIFWPISVPYIIYRWHKNRTHNRVDHENAPVQENEVSYVSTVQENEETQTCTKILKTVIIGLSLLIPIFWPISVPYIIYRWHKNRTHNRVDHENAPECNISLDINEDEITIKLTADFDGQVKYKLDDDTSFHTCVDGYKIKTDGLSVGLHEIVFQCIPTGSSQLFYKPHKFTICLTIVSSVIPDKGKDTATMNLNIKPKVDGTFHYLLDNNEPFQQCLPGEKLSNLSAGTHDIVFKFVPTGSDDALSVSKRDQFEIEPIANVSISVMGDVVIMGLECNFEAKFQYSLDGAEFQSCSSEVKFSRLLAGPHAVKVEFIPDLQFQTTIGKSKEFLVQPKANGFVTISKDTAVIDLIANADGVFQYSLDGQEFEQFDIIPHQNCLQEIPKLTTGRHSLRIQLVSSALSLELKPFIKFTMLSKDWYTSQCPPVRLQNLGNTCFFNSALQSTFKTDMFHQWDCEQRFQVSTETLVQTDPEITLKPFTKSYEIQSKTCDTPLNLSVLLKLGPLTEVWSNLLTRINVTDDSLLDLPENLLMQLGKRNPRFVQGTQEDSHEALRCLFDAIKNEEIEQVKKEIKEHFGVTNSQTEASLDGEDKLKMKGYLRMASKVPTVIGQAIEGKIVSVTICHECQDVSENVEAFFDISLPMPEENMPKYEAANTSKMASYISASTNNYSDENGNCVTIQLTDRQEDLKEMNPQSDNSGTKINVSATESETEADKLNYSQVNPSSPISDKGTSANIDFQSSYEQHISPKDTNAVFTIDTDQDNQQHMSPTNINVVLTTYTDQDTDQADQKHVPPTDSNTILITVTDEDTDQANQQYTQPTDYNTIFNADTDKDTDQDDQQHMPPTDSGASLTTNTNKDNQPDPNASLTTDANKADEQHMPPTNPDQVAQQCKLPTDSDAPTTTGTDKQHSIPLMQSGVLNDTANHHHLKKPEGLEGSDTCTTNTPAVTVPGITPTELIINNSDNSDTQSRPKQVTHAFSAAGMVESSLLAGYLSQKAKQEHQKAEVDNEKYLITHNKHKFQKYLIKKELNYQPQGKRVETSDLQFCLSMYTDLDVLDEDNKFICQACTKQNQLAGVNEPALCQVSKQIMIHQLPPILILHMKRFDIGFDDVTKDDRHISFPEVLDMAPYCTAECLKNLGDLNGRILYGLYAVVVHHGYGLHGGHYIAHVKTRPTEEKTKLDKDDYKDGWYYDKGYCKKGQWYYTSDSYVRECSLKEVQESKAYMLFYEQLPFIPTSVI